MKTTIRKSNHWNLHLFLSIAGTSGIVGLFLPFSWDVSPLKAVLDSMWQLATPAFISIVVTIATIRWLVSGEFSKTEKAIAYIISLMGGGVMLSVYFLGEMWPTQFREWFASAASVLMLILGVYLFFRKSKIREFNEINPIILLEFVYIANCLFCLVLFWPDNSSYIIGGWQIGAYFCLAASIIYLIQITLFLTQGNEISKKTEVSVP